MSVTTILQKVPLFSQLAPVELERLAEITRERSYPRNSVILFEDAYDRGVGYANYDVSGKGPRFLMVRSEPRPAPTQLNVILNWFSGLGQSAAGAPPKP